MKISTSLGSATSFYNLRKIYFKGWRPHITDGNIARNLLKTKELLGDEAYEYCKKYNISSRWSAKKDEAILYYPPNQIKDKT